MIALRRYLSGMADNAQPATRSPKSERRADMLAPRAIAAACLLCAVTSAQATAQALPISPANSQVGYVALAFGLIPIHGAFQRFHGVAVLDSVHPLACHVDVTIDVASLRMADPFRQRQALEPDMLAPDQFPTMHFTGRCQPGGLAGTLTMHGVSQPVSFVMHRTASGFTAWGALRRQDFGIDGLPHLVGSQVRIKLTAPMPPAFTTAPP